MASEFSKPISGKRLIELFTEHSPTLFPNLVSQSPQLATERAEKFFGLELTQAATNIPALAEIRNHIYGSSTDKRYIDSFTVILPHTHWSKQTPIIYTFDKPNNRYIIGPHAVVETQTYIPVSFAFFNGGILPFEWADETVIIANSEFDICTDIISKVASHYNHTFFPFGIAIDFRFKATLFSIFGGTIEIPEEDDNSPFAECSYILAQTDYDRNNMNLSLAQVAWHPRSDKLLALSDEETTVLTELRTILSKAKTDEERNQIIADIEKQINH